MSAFDEALATDRDLLRTVLQLQRAFYESWGRWPTVAEMLAQLRVTGASAVPRD